MEGSLTARRLGYALVAVVGVLAGGTIGFHQILGESWLSACYRTVVTCSLAGLDSVPVDSGARVLSIVLILAGVTIFAFVGAVVVEAIARGILTGAVAERRRRRTIERMEDHFIICGYGRVGRRVADEFRHSGAKYVILDFNKEALEEAAERGDLFVEGTGTEDEDLEAAGLSKARGIVVSSDSDADNLYITLSARAARPDLLIVTRASDEDAEKKLRLAGADRVVLPLATAGRVMANLLLKPQVAAFLNVVTTAGGPDLRFEQIEVQPSPEAGKSIGELRIRERTGAAIVAVSKQHGSFDTRPAADTILEVGDVLIGVGSEDEIRALEDLFAPAGARV